MTRRILAAAVLVLASQPMLDACTMTYTPPARSMRDRTCACSREAANRALISGSPKATSFTRRTPDVQIAAESRHGFSAACAG